MTCSSQARFFHSDRYAEASFQQRSLPSASFVPSFWNRSVRLGRKRSGASPSIGFTCAKSSRKSHHLKAKDELAQVIHERPALGLATASPSSSQELTIDCLPNVKCDVTWLLQIERARRNVLRLVEDCGAPAAVGEPIRRNARRHQSQRQSRKPEPKPSKPKPAPKKAQTYADTLDAGRGVSGHRRTLVPGDGQDPGGHLY